MTEASSLKVFETTEIIKVIENEETKRFKVKFNNWKRGVDDNIINHIKVDDLIDWVPPVDEETYDTDGDVFVWLITDTASVLLDKSVVGSFYRESSYLIYFQPKGEEMNAMDTRKKSWYWQGSQSKTNLKLSTKVIEKLQNKYGDPPLLTLKEGFEPPDLLALFGGCFIVHIGEDDLLYENYNKPFYSLYEITGTRDSDTMILQCSRSSKNLKSSSVFVLHSFKTNYVWYGSLSNSYQRKVATRICENQLKAEKKIKNKEGKETQEYWDILGGKEYYKFSSINKKKRLFVNLNSNFLPAPKFSQNFLVSTGSGILDTYNEIYLWNGSKITNDNRNFSKNFAEEYVSKINDGRKK